MPLHALSAFEDNYIWTLADGEADAVVVDPGQAGPVLAAAAQGLRPRAILLTHHHPDHCGGVAALQQQWPDLPTYAPHDERIAVPAIRVAEGERISLKNWEFRTLEVPGHTRSHVAFVGGDDETEPYLFCGDTLFSLGCGRMFEGTPLQMLASLDRLAALPAFTRVCCGHEYTLANAAFALTVDPRNDALRLRFQEAQTMRQSGRPTLPTTLGQELATNPFLRVDQPEVQAAVAAHVQRPLSDRVEVFAELRRWKDGFVA